MTLVVDRKDSTTSGALSRMARRSTATRLEILSHRVAGSPGVAGGGEIDEPDRGADGKIQLDAPLGHGQERDRPAPLRPVVGQGDDHLLRSAPAQIGDDQGQPARPFGPVP